MNKEIFKTGETVFCENTDGNQFYLIHKGKVKISQNNKTLRILEGGSHFGEISLLTDKPRSATVLALEETVCYTLSNPDFSAIIDAEILKRIKAALYLYNRDIELKDLFYVKFLGKGKFGSVSLVHNKHNVYAIKAVSRKVVETQKLLARYFISEKKIMQAIEHPFIIKFVKTLKNEHSCFFLLEYINGKNLDEYLNKRKYIRNACETKFFMACLLTVISYLHKRGIAHRDLKPENIMIDKTGYLKLIDFGTAKKIEDFTQTIIGTPHYIAPEILLGKGYSLSSDYWSVGVCMYEIQYGMYPFGNNASDVLDIYKDILQK